MARTLVILSALCLALIAPAEATASPRLCQGPEANGYSATPRPNGVEATYLYAKLDGRWVEPQNVCVALTFNDSDPFNRFVTFRLWNTNGFFFDLSQGAGIPTGTPITLGLHFPAHATPLMEFGQYKDGVVAFAPDSIAIQARTAPWTYVGNAYNEDKTGLSDSLDCSRDKTTWESTFGGFIRLPNRLPDGSEGHAFDTVTGAFFEANTLNMAFPALENDGHGDTHVLIDVLGCGDDDPKTLEGHYAGFMPLSMTAFLGFGQAALGDGSRFMSSLVRVSDELEGARVAGHIRVARPDDFAFDPIDGVTFPPLPTGTGPVGLLVRADYSYSKHRLDFAARTANLRVLKRCTRRHGKLVKHAGKLRCHYKSRGAPRAGHSA